MRKLRQGLCLAVCALAVQMIMAADPPQAPPNMGMPPSYVPPSGPGTSPRIAYGPVSGCEPAGVAKAGAKSPADLSGALPVPDYLDALFDCTDVRFLLPPGLYKPRNAWLEKDMEQYAGLLARGTFSWLIVPAQTQYYGFDRIERALLSAEIADAFDGRGNAPDPLLVARALGEVRRRYEPGQALELASKLGVSRVLETYVGHDNKHRMTLTLQLMECRTGGDCKRLKQHDWRNLPFTDAEPPFLVVRAMRGALIRELLGDTVTVAGTKTAPRPKRPTVPDLSALGKTPTTAEPAAVAAVIAALAPDGDELGRDRLQVLALREALNGSPSTANRTRAAYAAYRLSRRPYALSLLDGQSDPAANTLRELLNGNLIEAQASLPLIEAPDLRLIIALAVQDVRVIYDRPAEFDVSSARRLFGDRPRAWGGVVFRRVGDLDAWAGTDAAIPKQLLDDTFPIPGQDLKSVMKGLSVVGREYDSRDPLAFAALRHLRQALSKLTPADCCATTRANSDWPIYWLAESILESNALKSVMFQLYTQGVAESAMKTLDEYDEFYAGQPDFEVLRFNTIATLASRASNERAERLMAQAEAAELSAAYWSQGQNDAARGSALRGTTTNVVREAYSKDYPPRGSWPLAIRACDALAYATVEAEAALRCLMTPPPKMVAAARADVARRFHGNAQAALMLKNFLPRDANADPVAELRAAVARDPEAWVNYHDLGLLLLTRDADYEAAQKVYLSYPEFKRRDHAKPVLTANLAYEVGSELFWRGQFELARPLYELSADLDTGSNGSMTSAVRLALIDGNYETAARESLERGQRYPNPYAFRDYLSLLYVLGHGDEARAGLAQMATSFDDPSAWVAAIVGQRMQSMKPEEFRDWVLSDDIRKARFRGRHYAPIIALWWMTNDRRPTADFPQLMRKIEADETRIVESDGIGLTRPHPREIDGSQLVRPSSLRIDDPVMLPAGSNAPSEYVLLADALGAFYAADYDAAVSRFAALADRYPIEEDDTMAALSYFAYAAAKTGDKLKLEAFISTRIIGADQYFDVWLARAYFAAVRHDADAARQALVRAFNVRPYTESRPIMTEYQFVEACEIVLKETGDQRVLEMMVDWAKRWQRIQPMASWAYAVEAQYSKNAVDVNRALAMTLYLDPGSPRIAKFDAAKVAAARAWLKANNPFLKEKARRDSRPSV